MLLQDPKIRTPLAISLGAIAGALTRYYLSLGINDWLGTLFPFSTLMINLSGAFLMGLFITFALEKGFIHPDVRLIIAVGFLGSYTTFSSYELDTEKLLNNTQNFDLTIIYWLGTVILGFLCLEFGRYLARRFY